MLTVCCPRCKNKMKYLPSKRTKTLTGKSKKCVYCGRSFSVWANRLPE